MHNDLATLNAQPRPLTVDGMTYQVHPLTLNDFGKLQAWVDAQAIDPFAVVQQRWDDFTQAQQKHLLAVALELSCKPKPKIGTEEADAFVRSPAGAKELFFLTISKGDPTFTREQAAALFPKLTMTDIELLFAKTDANKVLSDPKAETTDGPTTGQVHSPSIGGTSTTKP